MVKTLTELKPEESGTVIEIRGGHGLVNRLNAMGVIRGKKITKVSSMFMRGPVTVQVNRTMLAVGFGMARKILVEVDRESQ